MLRDPNTLNGSCQIWNLPDSKIEELRRMLSNNELEQALDLLALYGSKSEQNKLEFDGSVIVEAETSIIEWFMIR